MSESKYIDLKFCLNMNNTQVGGTPMPTDSTNNDPGTGTPIPTDGTPIPTDVTNKVVSIAIGGNSNKLIPLVYQL